jgi:hypothetical protein
MAKKKKYVYTERPILISKALHEVLKRKAKAEGVFLGHLAQELINEGLRTYPGRYRSKEV